MGVRVLLVSVFCFFLFAAPAMAGQGRCTVKPTSSELTSTQAFAKAIPASQYVARRSKVPVSVTLAQFILESGWGQFNIGVNNYFGIKAQSIDASSGDHRSKRAALARSYDWGRYARGCIVVPTTEVITIKRAGEKTRYKNITVYAAFRAYRSMRASIADHGNFLVVNSRYRPAFRFSNRPYLFARAIHRAGYATSPTYSDSLIRLIKSERLRKYDVRL